MGTISVLLCFCVLCERAYCKLSRHSLMIQADLIWRCKLRAAADHLRIQIRSKFCRFQQGTHSGASLHLRLGGHLISLCISDDKIVSIVPLSHPFIPSAARLVAKTNPKRALGLTTSSLSDYSSPSLEFSPGDPLECLTLPDLASTKNVSH